MASVSVHHAPLCVANDADEEEMEGAAEEEESTDDDADPSCALSVPHFASRAHSPLCTLGGTRTRPSKSHACKVSACKVNACQFNACQVNTCNTPCPGLTQDRSCQGGAMR
eukprot:3696511-Rhodomonas_salina.1